MSSIMDLLARTTSPQDRFMQLLSLQGLTQRGPGAPGSVDPNSTAAPQGAGGSGTPVGPNGDTAFNYTAYPQPYTGVPSDLVTRKGVTLQPGPMKSLWQIARESNILPGVQEIGQIDQGYRSVAAQAAAYAAKPGIAAPPGQSYHGQGLAIDAAWWYDHPELARALSAAGWNQFNSSLEPWHGSYGVTG